MSAPVRKEKNNERSAIYRINDFAPYVKLRLLVPHQDILMLYFFFGQFHNISSL